MRLAERKKMTGNDLTRMFNGESAKAVREAALAAPTGSRVDVAAEMMRRCAARERRVCQAALDAESEGDEEGVWIAMAARAENNRFKARLLAEVEHENAELSDGRGDRSLQ